MKRLIPLIFVSAFLLAVHVGGAAAGGYDDASCLPKVGAYGYEECYLPSPVPTGAPYSWTLNTHGGCPPFKFHVADGALPPGLQVISNGASAIISGTPTAEGQYRFNIQYKSSTPTCLGDEIDRYFNLTVKGAKLTVQTNALPAATTGTAYSQQLATNSSSAATWSLASGTLPTGISLASSGMLSGTPSTAGASTFVVQAATSDGQKDTKQLTLQVFEPLKVTAPAATPAEVGRPFSAQLTASGGSGTHTWTATGVPDGLTFDPNTATLSGTPATPGAYTVKITAADATASMTQELDMQLKVAAHVTIVSRKLHSAAVGKAYVLKLLALGGVRPLTWRAMSKLPAGLRLAPNTGAIIGKPRRAGTYHFRIRVTDALRAVTTQSFLLKVKG